MKSASLCSLCGTFASQPTGRLGFLHEQRLWLNLSYCVGIAGFCVGLFPLTNPGLYGGSWLWEQALANVAR